MDKITSYYKQFFTDHKHWLNMAAGWFIFSAILGGLAFFLYPQILERILSMFDDRFGPSPALNNQLVIDIFVNNLKASAIALFGGLLLGVGSVFVIVTNGFILGYIIFSLILISKDHIGPSIVALVVGIVPHGIFEIPAFLLASAIGLKLGLQWLKKESAGQRLKVLRNNFKSAILGGIPAVVAILFIAAIIEVYVSGNLLDKLVK